jgi:NADP-dependent 3-hydroxy acid dehydrogenase YdfG
MTNRPLIGSVALVTGASSGIGAATARRLAREGVAVAVVARRRARLDELADDITAAGGTAFAVPADITVPDLAAETVEATLERFNRLDVLVNNASVMLLGTALHTALADWDRMVAVNVEAVLHLTHAAVPYLIDAASTSPRGVADIVNVSCAAARVARPASSAYTMTKLGLNGFTEVLRQELLVEGVRVSVVTPGTVGVETVADPGGCVRDGARGPSNRVEALLPEDVADTITYIVTRDRRVAINEILVRAGGRSW